MARHRLDHRGRAGWRRQDALTVSPAPMDPPPSTPGWNAGARGEPPGSNPYPAGAPDADAWERGHVAWRAFVAEQRRLWEASVRAHGRGVPSRAA
jgi:hypothetical protein